MTGRIDARVSFRVIEVEYIVRDIQCASLSAGRGPTSHLQTLVSARVVRASKATAGSRGWALLRMQAASLGFPSTTLAGAVDQVEGETLFFPAAKGGC